MPSEKVTQILLSKTDLLPEQIKALSEPQAWRLVYELPKPERDVRLEVCFTGFAPSEKAHLSARAAEGDLRVVSSVTKNLALLVCGPNAGPVKLEKAAVQGVTLLDADEFGSFLTTGKI